MNKKLAILFSLIPGFGLIYIGLYKSGLILFLTFHLLLFLYNVVFLKYYIVAIIVVLVILLIHLISIIYTVKNLNNQYFNAQSKKIFLLLFFLAIVLFFCNREFSNSISRYKHVAVSTKAMIPSISYGEYLIVDTKYFSDNNVNRGDIVSYYEPTYNDNIIRKCIAIGGDKVDIIDGNLYLNDEVFIDYDLVGNESHYDLNYTFNMDTIYVNKDSIFTLADNYVISLDSRLHGTIKISDLEGKVLYSYYPAYKNFK